MKNIKLHLGPIKSLCVERTVFSASKDGVLRRTDPTTLQSDVVYKFPSISVFELKGGFAFVGCDDGSIYQFDTNSNDVTKLPVSIVGRPSSILVRQEKLVVGTWAGYVHDIKLPMCDSRSYSFGSFEHEDRTVENGVHALLECDSLLVCGLASGEIVVFGPEGPKRYGLHDKPVRQLVYLEEHKFASCGNDGKVCILDLAARTAVDVCFKYMRDVPLYTMIFEEGLLYCAGEGIFGFSFDPKTLDLHRVYLLKYPCNAITLVNNCLLFGHDNGTVTINQRDEPELLRGADAMELKEAHFCASVSCPLDLKLLGERCAVKTDDDAINTMEQLAGTRLALFSVDGIPRLFVKNGDAVGCAGDIALQSREKHTDPKSGEQFDYCYSIQAEFAGFQVVQLYMNEREPSDKVIARFLRDNQISINTMRREFIANTIRQLEQFVTSAGHQELPQCFHPTEDAKALVSREHQLDDFIVETTEDEEEESNESPPSSMGDISKLYFVMKSLKAAAQTAVPLEVIESYAKLNCSASMDFNGFLQLQNHLSIEGSLDDVLTCLCFKKAQLSSAELQKLIRQLSDRGANTSPQIAAKIVELFAAQNDLNAFATCLKQIQAMDIASIIWARAPASDAKQRLHDVLGAYGPRAAKPQDEDYY